jgi:hypothetical protein
MAFNAVSFEVSSDMSLLRRWGEAIPPQRAEAYKMAASSAEVTQSLDKITFFKIG